MAVEGVSKLSFQCGSRDAKFCVSTIWLDKLLILNVLYVVANIETRHGTSLLMAKSHFDTLSTIGLDKLLMLNVLCVFNTIETRHGHASIIDEIVFLVRHLQIVVGGMRKAQIVNRAVVNLRFYREPRMGLEPMTFSLRMKCSTN